ncbi:hypothetical protein EMMF5_005463 [Cystobasidiomycetes sp. EMM_F5]
MARQVTARHAALIRPQQRSFFWRTVEAYESGVVFRFGVKVDEKGPGFRLDLPLVHRLRTIDQRVQTLNVPPQDCMTSDNVTIHVDAVAFFEVVDASKAMLRIVDYKQAVFEAAQTSLRSQLSRNTIDSLLKDREEAGHTVMAALQKVADDWGVRIHSVQLKNVKIDPSMVRAMGRKAEASRVREARIIEADAEVQASHKLVEAAQSLKNAPMAMRLRELQTYTQIAAEGNTVLIPANLSYESQAAYATLGKSGQQQKAGAARNTAT